MRVPQPAGAAAQGDHSASSRLPITVEAYLTATHLDALAETAGGLAPHEEAALAALQAAAAAAAPPVLSATALVQQLEDPANTLLSTGCAAIDAALLNNGLRPGQVVEVCGASASGKTQLCLAAAAQTARLGHRVVYVDTSNALSGRRLAGVAAAQAQAEGGPVERALGALRLVEVRRCYEAHSLLALLDELLAQQAQQAEQQAEQQGEQQAQQQGEQQQARQAEQQAEQQAQQQGEQQGEQQPMQDVQQAQQQQQQQAPGGTAAAPRRPQQLSDLPIGLLVVDSLSALITPILGGGQGQHSQGHALLAAAAHTLKALAAGGKTAVLVTNHMVGGSDERRQEKRPAMGESWRNQAHARIELSCPQPAAGSGDGRAAPCVATLRASSIRPAGAAVGYHLCEAGLAGQAPPPAHGWATGAAGGPAPMRF